VKLLLFLLELHGFDERLLALHELALLLLLHLLAVPLLPLLLHLLDLQQTRLVPSLLGFQTQVLRVHARHQALLDLLVPHEALRQVGVAEGVLGVGVPGDLALFQTRAELLRLRGWGIERVERVSSGAVQKGYTNEGSATSTTSSRRRRRKRIERASISVLGSR